MRSLAAGSRLQRATVWLVVALLALVALMPSDRVTVCLCPVDGMELALGRSAETGCHGVDGHAVPGNPAAAQLQPAGEPLLPCSHVALERAPCVLAAAVGAGPYEAAALPVGEDPRARERAGSHRRSQVAPPDPPPTALPSLRRCTVFLV